MMRNRSIAFLMFGLFVVFATTDAQDRRLTMSGIVTDSRSHKPVEGATVTVVGNRANPDTTDRDGNFILTFSAGIHEGEVVRVRVEKSGYKVYEVKKPVSPTMPLQFSIDRIAPTAPPGRTRGSNSASITEDNSGKMLDAVSGEVRRQPSNAQMEIIKEIERLIVSRDESALRQAFGFPSMMETNIRMNIAIVRHFQQPDGKVLDLRPYLGAEWMLDSELAEGHIRRFGGGFQYDPPDGKRVYLLALPGEYSAGKRVLFKFENSTELPTSVVGAIKNLDDAVYENANQLLHVLNSALKNDLNYYLRYDDQTSPQYFHKIDAMWLDNFVELRPKADAIRDAIRKYFQVE